MELRKNITTKFLPWGSHEIYVPQKFIHIQHSLRILLECIYGVPVECLIRLLAHLLHFALFGVDHCTMSLILFLYHYKMVCIRIYRRDCVMSSPFLEEAPPPIACGTWQFCLHSGEPCSFGTFLCITMDAHVTARGVHVITMNIRFRSMRG